MNKIFENSRKWSPFCCSSASNQLNLGRPCLKQKNPKIDTLDALGDETYPWYAQDLTKYLKHHPHHWVSNMDPRDASASKKFIYLYLSKKNNLSASLRPSLAKDLLPKQLQAEFNTTLLTNILKHLWGADKISSLSCPFQREAFSSQLQLISSWAADHSLVARDDQASLEGRNIDMKRHHDRIGGSIELEMLDPDMPEC